MKIRCLLIDNGPPALKKVPIRYISEIDGRGIVTNAGMPSRRLEAQLHQKVETLFFPILKCPTSSVPIFKDLSHPARPEPLRHPVRRTKKYEDIN